MGGEYLAGGGIGDSKFLAESAVSVANCCAGEWLFRDARKVEKAAYGY
jgi:hypothetical protein